MDENTKFEWADCFLKVCVGFFMGCVLSFLALVLMVM
jgi:hypothetical protein